MFNIRLFKSDKSFIIFDEKIPLEKKKIIIKKLKIKTILADNSFKNIFKGVKVLKEKTFLKTNTRPFKIKAYKNNIVYYVFTSGSTGEPKGVQISNKNLLNFIFNYKKKFKFKKNDKFILLPYLSFDLSVFPLWNSLFSGSTLCYPNGSDILYPLNYIKKNKISIYCSVPSQVDIIKNFFEGYKFHESSVRLSVFCGEPLRYYQVKHWKKFFSNSKIYNTYGPSETTCFNTYFLVKKINQKTLSEIVSIGRALPNNKIFLKRNEIVISGEQVSSGYVDSRLDKNKFFKFKNIMNYKTGDFAKKIGNNFFFLGRKDQQVKISGYRVELGDIEQNISKILDNRNVIVFTKKKQIYSIIEGISKISQKQRQLIEKNLAKHMIPKKNFFVSKFPLNKNMKIDKKKIIEKFSYGY